MKTQLLSILIFTLSIVTYGQDQPIDYKHHIGVGAGLSTGVGLSYRYFPGKMGIQVIFTPYITKETTEISA